LIRHIRVFINVFSRKVTGFHRWAKLFELNLLKKNFPLDGQTRWAKSSSQPVNLPSTQALPVWGANYSIAGLPAALSLLVPIYTRGLREGGESSVLLKKTTQ